MIDNKVNIDDLPPEARARVMAQIGEDTSKKRVRPEGVCTVCAKRKAIYNHLGGDQNKPLCGACSMTLHRQSPGAIQVKLLKLCATAIGAVETMLGMPVEEKQKKSLQNMQDELKLMVRGWLGDPQADEENDTATASAQGALPAGPAGDGFGEARKAAASGESDPLFEAAKSTPSTHKGRKTRKTAKTDTAGQSAPDAAAIDPATDPAYEEYLRAPLA